MPEGILRRYMDDIEVPNDDANTGFLLRRPSRAERSVDDPIREMEGMLVDEYGRYCVISYTFHTRMFFFCVCVLGGHKSQISTFFGT